MKPLSPVIVLILVSLLAGCSDKSPTIDDGNNEPLVEDISLAPVANAGQDLSVVEQDVVNLLGSGSDDDGSVVSYSWIQTEGTTVVLNKADTSSAHFTAPAVAQTLVFALTVEDDAGNSNTDTVNVSVALNTPPVTNAGSDQTVKEKDLVTLAGSATDIEGTIVSYLWTQISGTPVVLSDTSVATPTFTAPEGAQSLDFQLTATDKLGLTHSDSVTINVDYIYNPSPNIGLTTYVQSDPIDYVSYGECSSFEANHHSFDLNPGVNELNAGHAAFYWGNDYSVQTAEVANILEQLKTDSAMQQQAIANMQALIDVYVNQYGVDITPSVSAVDGKCYRVNIYFYGTGMWAGDNVVNYGGGARCEGYTTYPKKIPTLEIPASQLTALATVPNTIPHTLAHEWTHAMQCKSTGRDTGWDFYIESYAQFVGNDVINGNTFSTALENEKFLALDAFFNRYGSSPFWIYMRHWFGDLYMGDILKRSVLPDEQLMEYLIRTAPFDCPVGDMQCRKVAFANFYGQFAASTVNYVANSTDEGVDFNGIKAVDGRHRENSQMLKVADKRYRIVDWLAPQRYGRNIIELIPDPNDRILKVKLDGWDIPDRDTQWRATVVATLDSSVTPRVEAWGEQFMSGTQVIDLDQWETQLGVTIEKLHVAVAAVPLDWKRDSELSAYSSPLRHTELDQYVYELIIDGAWPEGHEPESLRDAPVVAGAAHSNGGGFVASTATVASTAYVGPEARVLDGAQVLDNARIEGRAVVYGNAIVQGNAIVSSHAEVYGNASGSGYATIRDNNLIEQTASISGEAKLMGDSIYYSSFSMTDKSVALGTPLIWNTGNGLSLSGTAIINGHEWLSGGALSIGTPYDAWGTDANGLFLHYDFAHSHPYRIEDVHASSDAYYLALTGKIGEAPSFVTDATRSSQVLELNGNGYLELPKLALDFHNYQLEMTINWQGGQTEYLLDARSARNEYLSVQLIPSGSSKYDVKLSFADRNGAIQTVLLQNDVLSIGEWVKFAIEFNGSTSTIKLVATPLAGSPTVEASAVLPTETREFDYDSLFVRLGADVAGTQPFKGRIDDVKLIR